jgi:hypothetical protein
MACDIHTSQFCHGCGTCRLLGCMYDNLNLLLTILWVYRCQVIVCVRHHLKYPSPKPVLPVYLGIEFLCDAFIVGKLGVGA